MASLICTQRGHWDEDKKWVAEEGEDAPLCGRKAKARGLCGRHYHPATRYPPESLRPAETKALLQAAARGRNGARNEALVALLVGSGLRIAEALAVRPHDLDLERGSVFVAQGKGGKSRTVAILKRYQPSIEVWLVERAAQGFGPTQPVFVTRTGCPINTSYARKLLPRLAREAGIIRRTHPHALRHTFAAEAARDHVRPELIQRQLGHSNLGTTTRYLSTISPDEVIDAFRSL